MVPRAAVSILVNMQAKASSSLAKVGTKLAGNSERAVVLAEAESISNNKPSKLNSQVVNKEASVAQAAAAKNIACSSNKCSSNKCSSNKCSNDRDKAQDGPKPAVNNSKDKAARREKSRLRLHSSNRVS